MVEIGVVPRDIHGHAIAALKQEDFRVYDESRNQTIKAFSVLTREEALAGRVMLPAGNSAESQTTSATRSATPPRSIALFFDDVQTSVGDLARAKIAARHFLEDGVMPGDRVATFTSSATVTLDFTSDISKVLAAVSTVQAHQRVSENGIAPCPRMTPYQAYLIANNLDPGALQAVFGELKECPGVDTSRFGSDMDPTQISTASARGDNPDMVQAMDIIHEQAEQTWGMVKQASLMSLETIEAILDSLSKQPGNRTLIVTSSGFLAGTMEAEQDKVISRALRSGVVISAIDAKGLYAEAPSLPLGEAPNGTGIPQLIFNAKSVGAKLTDLAAPLANFAEGTGGLLFRNNNDLNLAFREVGMVPEFTYVLGIEPAHDGKYHHLRVSVAGVGGQFVQTRPGYFAPLNAPSVTHAESPENDLDNEVFAADSRSDIAASVETQEGPLNGSGNVLWVNVHVDISTLKFDTRSERHAQQIVFISALLSDSGQFVSGKHGRMDLMLKDGSFTRFSKTGISAKTFLQAPAGHYNLRQIVRDSVEGKIYASTTGVDIR